MDTEPDNELLLIKDSKTFLYLSHIIEDIRIRGELSPNSLIVKNNNFFNTSKYQLNTIYKPTIIA